MHHRLWWGAHSCLEHAGILMERQQAQGTTPTQRPLEWCPPALHQAPHWPNIRPGSPQIKNTAAHSMSTSKPTTGKRRKRQKEEKVRASEKNQRGGRGHKAKGQQGHTQVARAREQDPQPPTPRPRSIPRPHLAGAQLRSMTPWGARMVVRSVRTTSGREYTSTMLLPASASGSSLVTVRARKLPSWLHATPPSNGTRLVRIHPL